MLEHYGVQIKNLSTRVHLVQNGEKHSFYYHKKDYRILGPDDVVLVNELENVIRVNSGLIRQRDLRYIVVLANEECQLLFICNGANTRVVLFNVQHPQGLQVLMEKNVTEPILGLTTLVNTAESKQEATLPWRYVRGYAAKLLTQHCTPDSPGIVKAIYRDGV